MFYKRWWTKCAPVFSPLNSAISDQLTFSFLVRLSRRCKWENIMIMLFDRRYFCSAMKCPTHRADKWCSSEVINKINKKIVELDRRLCVRVCLAARKCDEIWDLEKNGIGRPMRKENRNIARRIYKFYIIYKIVNTKSSFAGDIAMSFRLCLLPVTSFFFIPSFFSIHDDTHDDHYPITNKVQCDWMTTQNETH